MYLHCWCIVGRFYIYEMSLNVFWNTLFDSISNSWVQHRKRNMKGTLLLFPWTHNVLLFISIQYVATSVTRWPNDMFKFGHLQLCKFAPSIEFSPKSIWISCQNYVNALVILTISLKFRQSGEILPNLITLMATLPPSIPCSRNKCALVVCIKTGMSMLTLRTSWVQPYKQINFTWTT